MTKSASADLVTFTEEIFNVKLHFLRSVHVTLSSNIKKKKSINRFFKNYAWLSTSVLVIVSQLWTVSFQNIFFVNGG